LLGSDTINSGTTTSNNHVLYSQFKHRKKKWLLDIGARANYTSSVSKVFIEPRLNVEYELDEHFRVKGSAEYRTQSISQLIEFTTLNFGLENQLWTLADNTTIPILKSNQFTAGLLFSRPNFKIDLDLYFKNLKGLNSYTRGFSLSFDDFSVGESVTKGLDILVKHKISNYTTWLSYTYAKTDFTFKGVNEGRPFSGNYDIRHSLNWSHSYKLKKMQFSAGWNFRTGAPYTQIRGVTNNNGFPLTDLSPVNSIRLDNYHRLDLSAVYTIL